MAGDLRQKDITKIIGCAQDNKKKTHKLNFIIDSYIT